MAEDIKDLYGNSSHRFKKITNRWNFQLKIINWATCGSALFIKWVPFFLGGGGEGGGYFWEVVVGVHCLALLILTLFQSNIYKVNVREYSWGFMSSKWTHHNLMMVWHEVLTHLKCRQPLNEDVFEVSVLRFFIISLKILQRVPFGVFLHYLLKFKPFAEFFPLKMCLQISVCVWLESV